MMLAAILVAGLHVRSMAASDPWQAVPDILARIVPPTFAKQDFNLTRYGARADSTNLCTEAFKAAIAAAHDAGGGRVVVPAGVFHTGPIHLQSNVELYLSAGSEIVFSDRFEDYLPPVLVRGGGIEFYNYSPLIYARDCTNVAVAGPGKLNGNAKAWWAFAKHESRAAFEASAKGVPVEQRVYGTPQFAIRPSFLCLFGCTNVLLEGFTIGSGPNWTIHPVYCQNVTIRKVNVDTDGPNNDGCDPDSCRDVLIEDCTFATGDDCVVLKSGYNEDGWRVGRPTENVVMRRCFSKHGHGGLVIGSEMSGGVRNVFMEDCQFDGTDRAVRIKSRADRGGVVENVYVRNLKVKNMQREVVIMNMDYGSDRNQVASQQPPVFRNMVIQDITAEGAPTAIQLTGMEKSPIENIRFENMTIDSAKGVVASDVHGLVFDNVQVKCTNGPVFDLSDVSDVTIQKCPAPVGAETFLKLSGSNSGNVQIRESDISGARQKVELGPGVPADAVKL